jgi:DNA repair exonuclease SbcCD ATPase subunit
LIEKSKAHETPLIKYPKNIISSLIKESEDNDNKCILCGGNFHKPELDYDTIDNDKIQRYTEILKDKQYSFTKLIESMKYWHFIKLIEPLKYSADYDFDSILNNYNKDTNDLYKAYEEKTSEYESMSKDMAKINELLDATQQYDLDKTCINIVEEFIDQAKEYYAKNITEKATKTLHDINPRYLELFIENGVYKCKLYDKDFTKISTLAVQSLSKGERTIVALSLILTIRDMFMKNLPLIMDESFANLDANNVEAIKLLINNDDNQWIIVSHDERLIT